MDREITQDDIREAESKRRASRMEEEISYTRFGKDHHHIPRGTVVLLNGRIIPGYPHIPRIFTLREGIEKNIEGKRIFLEEKIDGFNLRIALVDGQVFAFSRGGYLDAFASEKARTEHIRKFFEDNPEKIICGEMIGNTPHTEPTEEYDIKLLVFDIIGEKGLFLACKKKYGLLDRYGIDSVPRLGNFSKKGSLDKIRKIANRLNESGKEGMVIKSGDRKTVAKYVMPNSDIEDIAKGSASYPDMPAGFFYQRILRSAMFIRDFSLDKKEYEEKLGRAFYHNLIHAIGQADNEGMVSEEFQILIKDPVVWKRIKKHMGSGIKIEEISREKEKGGTRIRFLKKYRKSSRQLKAYLRGKSVTD